MNVELSLLENKVEHLIRLIGRLRQENTSLNEKLSARETEISQLRDTIAGTRVRLEELVTRIPDEDNE